MGKLAPTIHERFEKLREEQNARKPDITFEQLKQSQAEQKKRNADFDARHVMPKGSRPLCIHCRSELRLFHFRAYPMYAGSGKVYGDYGDNLFCGLRCGHAHGVMTAGVTYGKQRGVR